MSKETQIIKICEVLSVDDSSDANRIKVRLFAEDRDKPISELPYAIPLLPMMLHVKPRKGEAVLVINAIAEKGNSQRYYIGPVISQVNHMYNEPASNALRLYPTSNETLDPKPTADTNKTLGAIPKNDEVALCGRKNSDVILSDDDVRIRCGAKLTDTNSGTFRFNAENPAYVKLKYHEDGLPGGDYGDVHSTATIVADRINLIGNKSKYHSFASNDKDEFITDESMTDLIRYAHQLPYGDILLDFLSKLRDAFITHTHPSSMLPPCQDPSFFVPVQDYNLNQILSDSVRIN